MTASAKLRFLAEIVLAEAEHLQTTDGRLFSLPMTPERAASLRSDIDLAEPVGPAIDNLNRAERLGWIQSVDIWLEVRRLRNRMVHEYGRDAVELASALMAAHAAVPLLADAAAAMARQAMPAEPG
jgi:hypothetical protein